MEISNILTSLRGIGTNFPGGKIVEGHDVDYIITVQYRLICTVDHRL